MPESKPLVIVLLGPTASGKTELAIEIGELMLKNRTITRNEAIAKLKEAKDLLDLGLMSSEEFEKMREELKTIILEK